MRGQRLWSGCSRGLSQGGLWPEALGSDDDQVNAARNEGRGEGVAVVSSDKSFMLRSEEHPCCDCYLSLRSSH